MAIQVRYEMPAADIVNAANVAGMGEWQQQQNELALRAAAMAQQESQFQQQQQFRQQAMLAEQQQQAWQNANRNAMMAWQRQNELADRGQQQQWQDARMEQQRRWHVNDFETQEANLVNRQQEMAGFQAANRGGEELEKEVGTALSGFSKQRKLLTPEGVNTLNTLEGKYRALQKARDWARPQQYAQAMSNFAAELQRSDLQQHVNTPKTVQQQVEEGGAFEKPVLDSSGNEIGTAIWTSTVRNGVPTLVPKIIPKKPVVDPREDWLNKNLKSFEDQDTKEVDIDRAMRAYEKIQAWKAANQAGAVAGVVPSLPPEPPRKPTVKTAQTIDEYWMALPPDKREALEKESATRIKGEEGPLGEKKPPSQEAIMDDVRKRLIAIHGFPEAEPKLPSYTDQELQQADELYRRYFPQQPPPVFRSPGPPPPMPRGPQLPEMAGISPPAAVKNVSAAAKPSPEAKAGFQRPKDNLAALSLVAQIARSQDPQGESGFPDPESLNKQELYAQLNSPAAKRIMAANGIINPTQPPGPPPPVIKMDAEGEAALSEMLKSNPHGVLFIDARDGKRKFISAQMLGQ